MPPRPHPKREERSGIPVAYKGMDGPPFPSMAAAARAFGVSQPAILKAVRKGYRVAGKFWHKASPDEIAESA